VVDDDDVDRRVCAVDLRGEGYVVIEASDAEKAVEAARELRPHLIVLDLKMPGKSGFECMLELKADEALRSIPVVMLTASDDLDDELQGIAGGADRYLVKPAHRDLLIKTVKTVLATSRQHPSSGGRDT
jgi:DNA-binding response OmpR family regulator